MKLGAQASLSSCAHSTSTPYSTMYPRRWPAALCRTSGIGSQAWRVRLPGSSTTTTTLSCSASAWEGFTSSPGTAAAFRDGNTGRGSAAHDATSSSNHQPWPSAAGSFGAAPAGAGPSSASAWDQDVAGGTTGSTGSSSSSWSGPFTSPDWGESYSMGDWGVPDQVTGAGAPAGTAAGQQQFGFSTAGAGVSGAGPGSSSSGGFGAFGAPISDDDFNWAASSSANTSAAGSSRWTSSAGNNRSTGSSSSSSSYASGNTAAGGLYGDEQQQQQQLSPGSWPFADTKQQTRQQQQQQPGGYAAGVSSGDGRPPVMPSDITLLGRRDADSMLPLVPSPEQARFYQPRSVSERLVQVLGGIGLSVALSKSAVLAGPALLYPVWGPWIQAGMRNMQMYLRQFTCVGLWRSEVLGISINTVPYAYQRAGTSGDTVTVTVGDPWQGGACTELTFPYQPGCEDIIEGEPAELLVLSQDDTFFNFKVVREVYLPQSGMWLSEYPFVDRDVFLDVSLAIERGRQAAAAAAAGGGSTTPTAAAAGFMYGGSSSAVGAGYGESAEPFSSRFNAAGFTTTGFSSGIPAGSTGVEAAGYTAPGPAGAAPHFYYDAPGAFAGAAPYTAATAAAAGDAAASQPGLSHETEQASVDGSQAAGVAQVAHDSYPGSNNSSSSNSSANLGAAVEAVAPATAAADASANAAGAGIGSATATADTGAGDNSSNSSSNSTSSFMADAGTTGQQPAQQQPAQQQRVSHVAHAADNGAAGGINSSSRTGSSRTATNGEAAAAGGNRSGNSNGSSDGSSSSSSSSSSYNTRWQRASDPCAADAGAAGAASPNAVEPLSAAGVYNNGSQQYTDGYGGYGSSYSSSGPGLGGVSVGFNSSTLLTNPAAAAADLVGGVANVASDVAAGVAAGLTGWLGVGSSGMDPGTSSSSSGSTAVLPDAIIEGPGMHWAPMTMSGYGYGGYGYYAAGGSNVAGGYMDPRSPVQQQWQQQQQQQQQQWQQGAWSQPPPSQQWQQRPSQWQQPDPAWSGSNRYQYQDSSFAGYHSPSSDAAGTTAAQGGSQGPAQLPGQQ